MSIPTDKLHTVRTTCRICGGKELVSFLNLGNLPLVNRYLPGKHDGVPEPRFPLEIFFCKTCSMSQLNVVVAPGILYDDYCYHSSVSKTFQLHCKNMAEDLVSRFQLGKDSLIVEIASNDGCLLNQFHALKCPVLGVEPASNLAAIANGKGLRTWNRFWDALVASEIESQIGKASLVVATNVLAHVDDVHGFIHSVAGLLKDNGLFVFEVPYMVNFINHAEFDTAYHEHLSYFLLRPLKIALEKNGLQMVDVQDYEIHGGSIRVFAALPGKIQPSEHVKRQLQWEEDLGLHEEASYLRFASHVGTLKEEFTTFIRALKLRNKRIAAYGASAKGNVLLNYCQLGSDCIDYIVDDTPAKQGKRYPGVQIPIVDRTRLQSDPPDYLILLAWNFVDELIKNTSAYQARGGRYVVPIPSLRIL